MRRAYGCFVVSEKQKAEDEDWALGLTTMMPTFDAFSVTSRPIRQEVVITSRKRFTG